MSVKTLSFITNPIMLMEQAINDMRLVQESDDHKLNMDVWHEITWSKDEIESNEPIKCSVCAAGSIMAFGLGANPSVDMDPSEFDPDTAHKLYLVNWIRENRISAIACSLVELDWLAYMQPYEDAFKETASMTVEASDGLHYHLRGGMKFGVIQCWEAFTDSWRGFAMAKGLEVSGLPQA